MNIKQNYRLLNTLLKSYGLMYYDIQDEFEARRTIIVNDEKKCIAPDVFVPTTCKISPKHIANGSYGYKTPTLKDWFEYDFRNETIMENLGNKQVVSAIQRDPRLSFKMNNGNLFLTNDGNHRLFNYLLLYLIEMRAVSAPQEEQEVEDKFSIIKPVHYEHDSRVVNAFQRRTDRELFSLPKEVYVFILNHSVIRSGRGDYIAYDPKTNLYQTVINGKTRSDIPEHELLQSIKSEPVFPKGMKLWKCKDTYYIACHNIVFKTKREKVFERIYDKFANSNAKINKFKYSDKYFAIKDLDSKTYDVTVNSAYYFSNRYHGDFEKKIVEPYQSFVKKKDILYHKVNEEAMKSMLGDENILFNAQILRLPERTYQGLTDDEFSMLNDALYEEFDVRQSIEEELGEE